MSSTYSPTAVALGDITIIADGDPKDAAGINVPMCAIADGVKHEATRTDALADFAALRAIDTTSLANNSIRHVKGHGLYYLDTGSSSTESEPFVIDPTTGPGRWLSSTAHETTRSFLVPACAISLVTCLGLGDANIGDVAPVTPGTNPYMGRIDSASALSSPRGFYPIVVDTSTGNYGFGIPLNDYLIDGATLATATLYFRPRTAHGALPTRQPYFGIVRTAVSGHTPTPDALLSTGSGLVQLAAASVAAYEADQALVFTPDQNNVIDRDTYSYTALIFDEGGTNAINTNRYAHVVLAFTSIPDARRS